jgi:two-component system, chemotaxis family, chemotaxis protein CheY
MRKKILIVDDSATVRREVSEALSAFEILEAADGAQGAELIETRADIDLAVCDINMPNLSGIEMLERVSGNAANKSLKIVMLTTEGQPSLIKRARELGAHGWVVKPFKKPQLLAAAQKLLGVS